MQVSAEEIIHNAIESEKEVNEYYGKSEIKLFEGEEMTEHMTMEEYVSGMEKKMVTKGLLQGEEVEAVNNGESMLLYDKSTGTAQKMDTGELADIYAKSPKDNYKMLLDAMQDSHTYELAGEEKLLDRDTFHIKMKAKETGNLLGDMDLWVDKDTWMVVKTISKAGNIRTESEYVELDFSPEFDEATFTLDIPDDVEITDIADNFASESVTVEEAEEALGQAFYLFSEEDVTLQEIELQETNMSQGSEEIKRNELNLVYTSKEDVPLFSLAVFPAPEDMPLETSDLEIRGKAAEYDETINLIIWDEEDLRYSLIITNPDLEMEEITKLTEEMVLSSEE